MRNYLKKFFERIKYNKKIRQLQQKLSSKRIKHNTKIRQLQKKYTHIPKEPSTLKRGWAVLVFAALSFIFAHGIGLVELDWAQFSCISFIPLTDEFLNFIHFSSNPSSNMGTSVIFSFKQLIATAPIIFIIWAYRDHNRLRELANIRKDTNLKEFQQLQQWATGNFSDIESKSEQEKIALQISALHSLRGYLKGLYGDDFRRGAYEIFASALQKQHHEILLQLKDERRKNDTNTNQNSFFSQQEMTSAIENNPLAKQLNRIASEEWFNLLVNHDFPTTTISLVGVDLKDTYLRHKKYSQSLDLRQAQLQGANFKDAQLQGANFKDAQLQGANFISAQLQGANFKDAQLQGAHFGHVQLQGADFKDVQLQGAHFWDAQLQGANFEGARLQGANFEGAQLQGANFISAQLQGANFGSAQLQGANFWFARLQGAHFGGAQLQGASFLVARLQGAFSPKSYLPGSFEHQIRQQIGTDTDLSGISQEALKEKKEPLIVALKEIYQQDPHKYRCLKASIECIQKSEKYDDYLMESVDVTSYSKEQADKWIAEYHQAMGF